MKKVLAMLIVMMLLSVGALAEGTLTAQGVGVVLVDADRAVVSLGVRESAVDVMTAQYTVNAKIEAVISALKAAGLADEAIETNGIGIYTNYDYSDSFSGEQLKNYTAFNSVVITLTDVDRVGRYIDIAFAAGANELDYVQFFAVDTAEAADKALTLAVEAARQKAQTLAAAAGVELGELLEIRDASSDVYDVSNGFAKTEEADSGAGTVVLASRQQVNASVTLVYAIGGE